MSYRILWGSVALSIGLAALSMQQLVRAQASATATPTTQQAEEPAPTFDNAFLSNDANIKTGEGVWENQCRHCHGASAYPGKAPKLKPGTYTPDFIYERVTYGFRAMPPWKDVFSVEERKCLVAYIKSDRFSP